MTCAVCDCTYDENLLERCPHCQFPPVEIVGSGEQYQAGLELLKLNIKQHCEEYLADVEIGIEAFYWKDSRGKTELDRKQVISIASGPKLVEGPQFHSQLFARLGDETTIPLTAVVKKGNAVQEISVNIPNLPQIDLQQIGVRIHDRLFAEFILKNTSATSVSDPFLL